MVGCFVLRRINPFRVIYCQIKFQTIHFSISIVFLYKQLNVKTVLFQGILFRISTQFNSIWPIDRTLLGATSSGQSGLGSDGNEGVLHIPQSSGITCTSPSDCLMSYLGHSLGESYPCAEKQSMYSTAPANWVICLTELFEIDPFLTFKLCTYAKLNCLK